MRITLYILLFIFCLISVNLKSQNAPVTTAGFITDATTVPETVVVPVTVKNFVSIGNFTLTLRYKANRVNYVSASPHPSLPGMTVTNLVVGTFGKLIIHWPQTPGGITLPDETHLLDLTFTYNSSTSSLVWITSDTNCYFKRYSEGLYILLNDSPEASYYINGGISDRGAPITYAPVINNPLPGDIAVPLSVNNFTSIGAMTLNLEYDQSVMTFVSCILNSGLGGTLSIGNSMGSNGKMIVTISWFGLATLPNASTLATINFTYSNANGTWSGLDFYETGSTCEYADEYANALIDYPASNYYFNGLIYTQYAPRAWLPVITNAIPEEAVPVPVYVNDFNNVRSFALSFEYDGAVMTYCSFTPAAVFGTTLTATDSPSGTKRKVVMSWAGTSDLTLPAGSLIGTVNFNYFPGNSALAWLVSDGTTCRFNDSNGNAYCDSPESTYYQDGFMASHVAPVTVGGQQSAVGGQAVVIPVVVYDYSNIGLFALTLDYDPAVLTYQSATLVPAPGGTFNAYIAGQGRIVMNWTGTATSVADSTNLVSLVFTYNGGSTTLEWSDDGPSCKYAETPSGFSLYDLPRSKYYINGYVGPGPLEAGFNATGSGSGSDTTITLHDLSTGGPQTWNWSISPSTYYFANGTSASSQNPQIKFTSNGGYSISMVISKGTSNAIRIRKDYIYIGTPGIWTGITSGDWTTGSNWHNFMVPNATTSILIPSAAPNWPHVTGDLAIGTSCDNITMQEGTELYIDGDLTINTGHFLTFTSSGTLFLGGDWSDSGVFNCGTGTIEFTGENDAAIPGGSSTETFYKITLSKTNSANLSVMGNINVTGTESK
jgi:hypothetical protein